MPGQLGRAAGPAALDPGEPEGQGRLVGPGQPHETTGDKTTATVQTNVRPRISIYRDGQWIGDVRGDYRTWTFHLVLTRGLTHGWKV
jgi:hypothetical protein